MKTILPATAFINNFDIVNFGSNKVAGSDIIGKIKSGSGKVKNLSKAKNIQNLAKFKYIKKSAKFKIPAKAIANKSFNTNFVIFKAKIAFTKLRKTFSKASILCYFDPKCYIWIKTGASS